MLLRVLMLRNRVLYPDLVFGSIASSAVTHSQIELWEIFDIFRQAADPDCSRHLQTFIHAIDEILLHAPHLSHSSLIALFGAAELKHDDEFAPLISVSCTLCVNVHQLIRLAT